MKKKNDLTRGFRLPMHLAASKDGLRPAMTCVSFKDGYMYATDARVAVKAKVSEFTDFDEAEIAILNGRLIDAQIFKILYKTPFLEVTKDGILDKEKSILYMFKDNGFKYPNVDAVIPMWDEHLSNDAKVNRMGLNPKKLNQLFSIMGHPNSTDMLKLSFHGPNKAILVENTGYNYRELVGVLMPVMLHE